MNVFPNWNFGTNLAQAAMSKAQEAAVQKVGPLFPMENSHGETHGETHGFRWTNGLEYFLRSHNYR